MSSTRRRSPRQSKLARGGTAGSPAPAAKAAPSARASRPAPVGRSDKATPPAPGASRGGSPSELSGRQYHIGLGPGEVAPTILLCGDPARARAIAGRFDERGEEVAHREYVTITGTRNGRPLTVMATGIGCDNTEIALVELCRIVERPTFLRIGTCGAIRSGVGVGELCVSSAALRLESTSLAYVLPGYPAAAHHEVVLALVAAATAWAGAGPASLTGGPAGSTVAGRRTTGRRTGGRRTEARAGASPGRRWHLGITATAAGFYGAQGRDDDPRFPTRFPRRVENLRRQGVLNFEMEMSTLFTLASLAGARAGGLCATFANRSENHFATPAQQPGFQADAIEVGLGAVDVLARMDAERGDGALWVPPELVRGAR